MIVGFSENLPVIMQNHAMTSWLNMLEATQREELPCHIRPHKLSRLFPAGSLSPNDNGKMNVPPEASQSRSLSPKKIYEETFWISHEQNDEKIHIQMWSKIKPSRKTEAEVWCLKTFWSHLTMLRLNII